MRFAILPAGAACGIWSPAGRQPLAQHAAATQVGVGVAEAPSGGMLGNGKKQTGAPSASEWAAECIATQQAGNSLCRTKSGFTIDGFAVSAFAGGRNKTRKCSPLVRQIAIF